MKKITTFFMFILFSIMILNAQVNNTIFKKVHIKKNETIELDSITKIMFLYHSHKKTIEGQVSPLITYIYYTVNGKPEEKQYNIDFDSENIFKSGWKRKDYIFIIENYIYDEYMNLNIYKSKDYPYQQNQFIISNE